ncbi:MAG: hypothetical protein KGI66_02075 [Patescibacteria group bacterium]|nr:hypothetical protein [Patescibacteria group bacterium]
MRRLLSFIFALAMCASSAFAVTVAGNLKTLGGSSVTTSTFVRFTLKNATDTIPVVSGSNTIVQPTQDFYPDTSGVISGTIDGNDTLTPGTTYYQVCILNIQPSYPCANYEIAGTGTFNLNSAASLQDSALPIPQTQTILGFTFVQTSSATTWTITHNLDSRAVVTQCFDSNWNLLTPSSLVNTDLNTTTVTFSVAETGSCVSQIAGPLVVSAGTYALALNPTANQVVTGSYLTTFDGPVTVNGAFTGAAVTANSLQGKVTDTGGQVYNVLADGCIADGVTDDTTCIQTAVSAAEATGGSVLFPPGTYKITSSIPITSPIRLDCTPSASTTFISTITSGAVFTFQYGAPSSGGAAAGVYGCSFQGPGLSNANSVAIALGSGTLSTTGAVSPVISNVSIGSPSSSTSGFGVGIKFVSSGFAYGAQITNPQIFNCAIAIDLYGNNNIVSNGALSSNQTGLLIDGNAPTVSVSNTAFNDDSVYGINVNTATSLTTANLQFGNPALGAYNSFLYVGAASAVVNVTGGTMSESRTTGTQTQFVNLAAVSDVINMNGTNLTSAGATVTSAINFASTGQFGRLLLDNSSKALINNVYNPHQNPINDSVLGTSVNGNDPRSYGAIGDGVHDDEPAFQAAEDALPACNDGSGGHSFLHCGEVLITTGIYYLGSQFEAGYSDNSPVKIVLESGTTLITGATGASVCGIRQESGTVIEGAAVGGGGIDARVTIYPKTGTTPYATFCTGGALGDPLGYYSARGFTIQNPNNVVTTSSYATVIAGAVDGSEINQVQSSDHTNNNWYIYHSCCATSFIQIVGNSVNTGGVPLTIGSGGGTPNEYDLNFFGSSFTHAKAGDSQIVINAIAGGGPINFYGTYVEGNTASADTAPLITATGVTEGLNFHALSLRPQFSESVDGIYIPSGSGTILNEEGIASVNLTGKVIDDQDRTPAFTLPAFGNGAVPPYWRYGTATGPINVRAYGAVGNGTTDDEPAIQAAENALPACIDNDGHSFTHCGEIYVPQGNYKLGSELQVGFSDGSPIHFVVAAGTAFITSATGSTNCGIEQMPQSFFDAQGMGGSGLAGRVTITSAASTSPYAVYCTYGALNLGTPFYYAARGFVVLNPNAITTTKAAIVLAEAADNSYFAQIQGGDNKNINIYTFGNCCGTSFYNLTGNSVNTGSLALAVGDGTHADFGISFFGGSFDHAKNGTSQIFINEPASSFNDGSINFYGVYVEGNTASADTSALVDVAGGGVVNFHGLDVRPQFSEAQHGIFVASGTGSVVNVTGMSMVNSTTSAISIQGGPQIWADANGIVPNYSFYGPQRGTIALSAGTATVTFSPAFPTSSSVYCTANDQTAANVVRVEAPTATSVKFDGTTTDTITYSCATQGQ